MDRNLLNLSDDDFKKILSDAGATLKIEDLNQSQNEQEDIKEQWTWFYNLPEEKRNAIISGELKEFSIMEKYYEDKLKKFSHTKSGLKRKDIFTEDMSKIKIEPEMGSISIFFADANNLKRINDILGHVAGDRYLEIQSQAIAEVCAKYQNLFQFDVNGNVILPEGMTMKDFLEAVPVYKGGETSDETVYVMQHEKRNPSESEAEYNSRIRDLDFSMIENIHQRVDNLCQIANLTYHPKIKVGTAIGVANTSEPCLRSMSITDVQDMADKRMYKNKHWHKYRQVIEYPETSALTIDQLRASPGYDPIIEKFESEHDLLMYLYEVDNTYRGLERRQHIENT